MDLTHYPYPSRRHVVLGRRGAVATSQPLAALAGMEMLQKGEAPWTPPLPWPPASPWWSPPPTGSGGPLRPGVGRNPPRPERLREKPHGPHPGKASREDAGAGLASRDRAGGGLGVAGPARALGQASLRRGPRPRHPLRRGRLPRGAGDGEELAAGRRRLPPPGGAGVWALQGGLLPRGEGPKGGRGVAKPPPRQDPQGDRRVLRGKPLPGSPGRGPPPLQRGHGGLLTREDLGPTPRSG